jgi:hypothetical protein
LNFLFIFSSFFYNEAQRQSVKKLQLSLTNILKNIITKDFIFVVLTMQHITEIFCKKLQMSSLVDKIGLQNSVRFVGFLRKTPKSY